METIKINLTIPDNKRVVNVSLSDDNEILVNLDDIEFKKGDFIYVKGYSEYIFIFNEIYEGTISSLVYLSGDNLITKKTNIIGIDFIEEIRFATKEEKEKLLNFMHSKGYDWDVENKKIIPYRWRAKKGEIYYRVSIYKGKAFIVKDKETGCYLDDCNFNNYNYYKTAEDTQKVADKINNLFRELWK